MIDRFSAITKTVMAFVFLPLFALLIAGCTTDNRGGAASSDAPANRDPGHSISLVDQDGSRLGGIDNRAAFTAVDGGIFYSVVTMKENAYTGEAEYRFFSLKDKTDVSLGKLEDQGYEAGFARTELNGMIYTLAVRGNPIGDDTVPLLLLAFDTANKTMKTVTVSEYGFPYAAMTASGGKLLIMNHEMTKEKTDTIYEFDPGSETIKEILSFSSSVDSLRGVCAANDGFYLLRLKLNNGGENEMYVDRYDEKYGKVSEQPITDILVGAITGIHGITGRGDALNEIGMYVSRFFLTDGRYLIYENFGLSRVAVDLMTKETILAKDDNYSVSTGSGAPILYKLNFEADTASEPELYGIRNGNLTRLSFTPDDAHRLVQIVTVSKNGTAAILTTDAFPVQNGTGVIRILPAP